MEITYKWSITGVDGTPETSTGLKDVALAIHWHCAGFLTDYDSIGNSRSGFVVLDHPDTNQQFIPYADLTEEMVFNWLFSKLDKQAVEAEIAESLKYAPELLAIVDKTPLGVHWNPNIPAIPPTPPEPV